MMIYGNIGPAPATLNHDPAGRLMEGARPGGAAYVTRTRDPIITNDVLYQLS
jgi:hypothetical protein